MDRFIDKYKIDSSRKRGWNYSNPGYYFITICTYEENNFFGKIVEGKMEYKTIGKIAVEELLKTFNMRSYLKLIAWVVMPNHVHMLFSIRDIPVETRCNASLQGTTKTMGIISNYRNHPGFYKTLNCKSNEEVSKVIREYKGAVKRIANQQHLFFGWQTRYYDEVIQDENKLKTVIYYIRNNVKNWEKDRLFMK